jgi:hypothetical protein
MFASAKTEGFTLMPVYGKTKFLIFEIFMIIIIFFRFKCLQYIKTYNISINHSSIK